MPMPAPADPAATTPQRNRSLDDAFTAAATTPPDGIGVATPVGGGTASSSGSAHGKRSIDQLEQLSNIVTGLANTVSALAEKIDRIDRNASAARAPPPIAPSPPVVAAPAPAPIAQQLPTVAQPAEHTIRTDG